MQRAVSRGALSFGLIYVPVDLMSASKDASLSLHFLDSGDFSPVGYQRINKGTGKEVDWAHIVKGYEYEKGHYVALSDADFKHANVKASEAPVERPTAQVIDLMEALRNSLKKRGTPARAAPRKSAKAKRRA